ncbi:MAG: winged helix-turn-helix domain-containing protein [Vulcanimicrobiaceae bacterium]
MDLKLLGTRVRTRVLLAIALLERSYPREIARVTGVPLMSVQRIVNDLERQGVLASRRTGVQREVRLNPSYFAYRELKALLLRVSLADEGLTETVESLRRRPRRAGKALS